MVVADPRLGNDKGSPQALGRVHVHLADQFREESLLLSRGEGIGNGMARDAIKRLGVPKHPRQFAARVEPWACQHAEPEIGRRQQNSKRVPRESLRDGCEAFENINLP